MKTVDGKCDDFSCVCRNVSGYCMVTGCIKTVPTATSSSTSGEYTEFIIQSSVSDAGLKDMIKIYLKNHTLSDLLKVLADIL